MKAVVLTLTIALASVLGTSAFAQSKGEVDPEQARAAATKPVSKTEKEAARKARVAEGKAVSKTATGADDAPNSLGAAKAASKEERKAARSTRKAETALAVKKGQTTSGEK